MYKCSAINTAGIIKWRERKIYLSCLHLEKESQRSLKFKSFVCLSTQFLSTSNRTKTHSKIMILYSLLHEDSIDIGSVLKSERFMELYIHLSKMQSPFLYIVLYFLKSIKLSFSLRGWRKLWNFSQLRREQRDCKDTDYFTSVLWIRIRSESGP